VYIGRDGNGEAMGVAISRGESGFQDVIMVIFGYDPVKGVLSGMKILDSKETPGLGDKIFKDMNFVDQFFAGPEAPLLGVKIGAGKGQANEIDMITGATISSKAVIGIINHALEEWKPILDRGIPEAPADTASREAAQ
jgi:electron transport complex protein RnfG